MSTNVKFVQGNEACVEGALYAGLEFFAGYPITPVHRDGRTAVRAAAQARRQVHPDGRRDRLDVRHHRGVADRPQGDDGHQRTGVFPDAGGAWAMRSWPRSPASSSMCSGAGRPRAIPPMSARGMSIQARWGTHGDHAIIALTASNHQDVFAMTVEAFNMAETYRTPVILLFDEVVGHMRERLVMPGAGEIPLVDRLRTSVGDGVDYHPYLPREDGRLPMSDFGGVHRYNVTGLFHDMWGFPVQQPEGGHGSAPSPGGQDREQRQSDRPLQGVLSGGCGDRADLLWFVGPLGPARGRKPARRGARRIGLLELQTLWPFPEAIVREKCARAKAVVVVEMNMGQVMQAVKTGGGSTRRGSFWPTASTGC